MVQDAWLRHLETIKKKCVYVKIEPRILARGMLKTTRTALEIQSMVNLLMIAKDFIGQPEKAAEFFDQSKLEDPIQSQETDAAGPTPLA